MTRADSALQDVAVQTAWTGLTSPRPEPTSTRNIMPHDSHYLEYCNQAYSLPPPNVTDTIQLNTSCPYHAKLLHIQLLPCTQLAALPSNAVDYSMLAYMLPFGLNDRCRLGLGTSASCGCTCATAVRDDVTREIDRIILEVRANTRNNTRN